MELRKIRPEDVMRYYVTYKDIEAKVLHDIHSKDETKRENAYRRYVNNHMKIARNFSAGADWQKIIDETEKHHKAGEQNPEKLSEKWREKALLSKTKAIVAASKLLWLFNPTTIIIDNYNMEVLGANNYDSYTKKWKDGFWKKEQEIISVIENHFSSLDEVVNEQWFRMRVFDQYLWTIKGEKEGLDILEDEVKEDDDEIIIRGEELYKENVKDALIGIVEAYDILHLALVNVGISGEFSEWHENTPEGTSLQFETDFFRDIEDENVKLLVDLIDKIVFTYDTMKANNNITE